MATKIRLEMHSARPIRYGTGSRALCEDIGRTIAQRANAELRRAHKGVGGKQFVMDSFAGRRKPYGRWRVSVTAVGRLARNHNARNQTLVRLAGGK